VSVLLDVAQKENRISFGSHFTAGIYGYIIQALHSTNILGSISPSYAYSSGAKILPKHARTVIPCSLRDLHGWDPLQASYHESDSLNGTAFIPHLHHLTRNELIMFSARRQCSSSSEEGFNLRVLFQNFTPRRVRLKVEPIQWDVLDHFNLFIAPERDTIDTDIQAQFN